jgi:hypothetical protein
LFECNAALQAAAPQIGPERVPRHDARGRSQDRDQQRRRKICRRIYGTEIARVLFFYS